MLIKTVLDWETAYGVSPTGRKVTLSAMTTEEYVRDPEFKVHGLGVKINSDATFYLHKRDDLLHFLKTHPWDHTFAIAHHAHFDGAIFSWRCGIRPKFWGCTLSMARVLYPHESNALGNLVKVLGLPDKGHELSSVKDKWVLTEQEQKVLGGYCINDVDITSMAFDHMKKGFPVSEMKVIDTTVRAFTEPALVLDPQLLKEEIAAEKQHKEELLSKINFTRKDLMSNDQFAALLLSMGVDPPKKLSPSKVKDGRVDPDDVGDAPMGLLPSFKAHKGETTEEKVARAHNKKVYPWAYAFGKTDEEFKLLLDHPDPAVGAVVEARLGVKSTINETRANRMLGISERGAWPVYLTYCAATTFRFGGGDKVNPQNFTRGSRLRKSIMAPEGHLLAISDLAQIEARQLAVLAGQDDLVAQFARGEDVYCRMASSLFGVQITKNDKKERFLGKCVILGAGYGMGWAKFSGMIRVGMLGNEGMLFGKSMADSLGVILDQFTRQHYQKALESRPPNVTEDEHLLHCACAKAVIDRYRYTNNKITALWKEANGILPALAAKEDLGWTVGVEPKLQVKPGGILMPNGLMMQYNGLEQSENGREWTLTKRRGRKVERSRVYGGLIVENLCQSLSRIVIAEAMNRIKDAGMKIVMQVHDEVVICSPEDQANRDYDEITRLMGIRPAWAPSLPLDSDGGVDKRYVK